MKKFLVLVGVLVILLAGVGLVSPTEYAIESSMVIDASPAAVHAYVGELRQWPNWAPWEADDESIVTTFGEKTTGVGAHQSWTSDEGDGELTFTACDADTGIAYDMVFIHDGQPSPASSAMTYRAVEGGTEVTWSMEGDWKGATPPIMDGWMQILTPMLIGGMFEKGLSKLKEVVEAGA